MMIGCGRGRRGRQFSECPGPLAGPVRASQSAAQAIDSNTLAVTVTVPHGSLQDGFLAMDSDTSDSRGPYRPGFLA